MCYNAKMPRENALKSQKTKGKTHCNGERLRVKHVAIDSYMTSTQQCKTQYLLVTTQQYQLKRYDCNLGMDSQGRCNSQKILLLDHEYSLLAIHFCQVSPQRYCFEMGASSNSIEKIDVRNQCPPWLFMNLKLLVLYLSHNGSFQDE